MLRIEKANQYDIDGLYLAYLLRHGITQQQIKSSIFIDTTIPSLRTRWRALRLPVSRDRAERERIKATMFQIYQSRLIAETMIHDLLNEQRSA